MKKLNNKNVFVFLLLLSIALTFPSPPPGDYTSSINPVASLISNPSQLLAALSFIAISTLVLMYMIGKATGNAVLEARAKAEFKELLKVVVIASVFLMLFQEVDGKYLIDIAIGEMIKEAGITCDEGNCLISLAKNNLNVLELTLKEAMRKEIKTSWLSLSGFPITEFLIGSEELLTGYIKVGYNFGHLQNFYSSLKNGKINLYKDALNLIKATEVFLNYAIPLSVLTMTLGIILAFIPYTRRFGISLLALSVGFGIIFPSALYVFTSSTITTSSLSSCPEACVKGFPVVFKTSGSSPYSMDADELKEFLLSYTSDEEKVEKAVSALLERYNETLQQALEYAGITTSIPGASDWKSCEYYAYNLVSRDQVLEGIPDEYENYVTWYCPTQCRRIPYPSDVPTCRDAETACYELWHYSKRACFKDLTSLAIFEKNVGTDEGVKELGEALGTKACGKLKPLAVPYKRNASTFCPTPYRKATMKDGYLVMLENIFIDILDLDKFPIIKGCEFFIKGLESKGVLPGEIVDSPSYGLVTMKNDTITSILNMLKNGDYEGAKDVLKNIAVPVDLGECKGIYGVTKDFLTFPDSLDCSGCETASFITDDGISKAMGLAYGGIYLSIGFTIVAVSALSVSLGGMLFIPGIGKFLR